MGFSRRTTVRALVALLVTACASKPATLLPEGSADKLVIARVLGLVDGLRAELVAVTGAIAGKDRGVDLRGRMALNSLDVVRGAVERASSLSERDAFSLLEPFAGRYAEFVAELEAEGLRAPDGVLDGGELVVASSARMNRRIVDGLVSAR